MRVVARATLLLLLLTFSISSKYLLNDHIITPKASEIIEKIGSELASKCDINAYVIATHDKLGRGVNLYDYIKKYAKQLSEPYVALIFAPNSKRIGIIVSDKGLENYYDASKVKSFATRIIGSVDSNSMQSKYDVGVVQAYSELADEIARKRAVHLKNTIKDDDSILIKIVTWLVYLGSVLVFWVYFFRPIYMRIRHAKEK
jgi:hypothetical protein